MHFRPAFTNAVAVVQCANEQMLRSFLSMQKNFSSLSKHFPPCQTTFHWRCIFFVTHKKKTQQHCLYHCCIWLLFACFLYFIDPIYLLWMHTLTKDAHFNIVDHEITQNNHNIRWFTVTMEENSALAHQIKFSAIKILINV